jgi:hypothetical protein
VRLEVGGVWQLVAAHLFGMGEHILLGGLCHSRCAAE